MSSVLLARHEHEMAPDNLRHPGLVAHAEIIQDAPNHLRDPPLA